MKKVDVFVKGPGSGRETAIRSLQSAGLEVGSINDVTPQAHNGVRPPKRRRVSLAILRSGSQDRVGCAARERRILLAALRAAEKHS